MSRTAILAIRIIADAAGAQRGLTQTTTGLGKLEAAASKATRVAVPALAGIGAAAYKATQDASDLAESTNAVGKVFGDNAGIIESFGDSSARAVGLSKTAFQELATGTGSLLTNMGQSTREAADNTVILAQRAADMASVYNVDVSQALSAVNAGLRGESEPLRALGITLSDNAVKAQAMAMGLYDGSGALDSSARAAATQALILEQSASVAGDFSDTSDGLANRQRIAAATMADVSAQLGTALIPYMETAVGLFQAAVEWVSNNTTTVAVLTGVIAGLSAAVITVNAAFKVYRTVQLVTQSATLRSIATTVAYRAVILAVRVGMLAWAAAQWALNVAMSANPIGLVILAIAGLIALVVLAWKRSETFRNVVTALGKALANMARSGIDAVSRGFSTLVGWIRSAWDWASRLIGKVGELLSKLNPLKGIGSLFGRSVALAAGGPQPVAGLSTYAADTAPTSSRNTGPVLIQIQAGDPWSTARAVKRELAALDITAGRPVGAAQAVAW